MSSTAIASDAITAALARIDEADRSFFLHGQCVDVAIALTRTFPGLGLLVLVYGDPDDEDAERHCMAHDNVFAYDASGCFPLGEVTSSEHVGLFLVNCDEEDVSQEMGIFGNEIDALISLFNGESSK